MRRCYLLVYNNALGNREQIKEALNQPPFITWRSDLPNCFYVISEASARELATYLKEKLGAGRFIISEIGENYWGFGKKDTWYLIKNKRLNTAKD